MKNYLFVLGSIALGSVSVMLMIIELLLPNWIEQGQGSRKLVGSLLSRNGAYYTNISCPQFDKQFCNGLMKLWKAGIIYLSLEIASGISLLISCFLLLKFLNHFKVKLQTILMYSIVSFILHTVGFIIWSSIVKLQFPDSECRMSFHDSETASICGGDGPVLSLCIMILILIHVACVIIALNSHKQSKSITPTDLIKEVKTLEI